MAASPHPDVLVRLLLRLRPVILAAVACLSCTGDSIGPRVVLPRVSPGAVSMLVGESVRLDVHFVDASGRPSSADATLEWASTDESVVSATDGLVTAHAAGSAHVTAKTSDGADRVHVEVSPVPYLAFTEDTVHVRVAENGTLPFVITDVDGAPLDTSDVVPVWRSLAPAIVRVEDGVARGLTPGTAPVEARVAGNADTTVVVVPVPAAVSLAIAALDSTPIRDDTIAIASEMRNHLGHRFLAAPNWSVLAGADRVTILAADDTALVIAHAAGPVQIVATHEALADTVVLQIADYPPPVLPGGSLLVVEIGGIVGLGAEVRGRAADLDLVLLDEQRWLDDVPVAAWDDATEQLEIRAPGRALFETRAAEFRDTLLLVVEPEQPTVVTIVEAASQVPVDTVTLRGYRLDEAGPVELDGDPAQVLFTDSATIRALVPPVSGCHGAARARLAVSGAAVDPSVRIRRSRPGEIDLAPGDTVRLREHDVACLRLAPYEGSEYALVYVDTSWVTPARTSYFWLDISEYFIRARDLTGARAGTTAPRATVATAHTEQPRPTVPPVRYPSLGVGDTFDGAAWHPPIRHVVVYDDGYYLVSVPLGARSAWTPAAASLWTSVLEFVHDRAHPLYEAAFGPVPPVNTANGRFLIESEPTFGTSGGSATYVSIMWTSSVSFAALSDLVVHEISHSWYDYNFQVEYGIHPYASSGTRWSDEGMAQWIVGETKRIAAGIEPFSNHEPAPVLNGSSTGYDGTIASSSTIFLVGYNAGANFLRDVAFRLVEQDGIGYEAARDTVMRRARHNLFGCERSAVDCSRDGVADLIEHHLRIDLTSHLIRFALSQAMDDVLPHDEWRNPYFLRMGDRWGNHRGDPITAAGGLDFNWRLLEGSADFAIVRDPLGLGGTFSFTREHPHPDITWVLARRR